jgi:hypothetical protein
VVLVHASGAVLFAGEDEAKVPPNGLLTEGVGDALVRRDLRRPGHRRASKLPSRSGLIVTSQVPD